MNYDEIFKKQYYTFLKKMYRPTDYISILAIDHTNKQKTKHEFCYVNKLFKEDFVKFLRYLNAKDNRSIYITVNRLKELKKQRIVENMEPEVNRLWFDIDGKKRFGQSILKELKQLLGEPTLITKTSEKEIVIQGKKYINKNYQVYYLLDRFYPYKEVMYLLFQVEKYLGIDETHDITRVFRLPGFRNRKPGINTFCSIVQNTDNIFELEKLRERFFEKATKPLKIPGIPPFIQVSKKYMNELNLTNEITSINKKTFDNVKITVKESHKDNTYTLPEFYKKYQKGEKTQSERDISFVIKVLSRDSENKVYNGNEENLEDILINFLAIQRADKRDPLDYARRTVTKAIFFCEKVWRANEIVIGRKIEPQSQEEEFEGLVEDTGLAR